MPRSEERRTQAERRESAERRVIETAVLLIAEHGTRAATLARVGEEAGYSRGIVTHHFGTRDRLLREVVAHAAGQVEVPEYAGDGLLQLRGVVRAYLRTIADRTPTARAFVRMWGEALAADPVLAEVFADQDARLRGVLAEILVRGVADGSMRADLRVDAAAVFVTGSLRGTALQLMSGLLAEGVTAVIDEAERLVADAFGA